MPQKFMPSLRLIVMLFLLLQHPSLATVTCKAPVCVLSAQECVFGYNKGFSGTI